MVLAQRAIEFAKWSAWTVETLAQRWKVETKAPKNPRVERDLRNLVYLLEVNEVINPPGLP